MKKMATVLSLAVLAGVAAFVSAEDTKDAGDSKQATTAATTKPENGAINQFCPIQKDNKIDPKGKTYTYNGKIIGFCCPDCIDDFKKDPEKYMKDLK
jgi:YHS domain-containing protein